MLRGRQIISLREPGPNNVKGFRMRASRSDCHAWIYEIGYRLDGSDSGR